VESTGAAPGVSRGAVGIRPSGCGLSLVPVIARAVSTNASFGSTADAPPGIYSGEGGTRRSLFKCSPGFLTQRGQKTAGSVARKNADNALAGPRPA
jgi:hypothetical protein